MKYSVVNEEGEVFIYDNEPEALEEYENTDTALKKFLFAGEEGEEIVLSSNVTASIAEENFFLKILHKHKDTAAEVEPQQVEQEGEEGVSVCVLNTTCSGTSTFNNEDHFKNFSRYLFGSKSGRHTINNRTEYNMFAYDPTHKEMEIFKTDNPAEQHKGFVKKFANEIKDFSKYVNDIVYIPFLISINGVAVSNFLHKNKNGETAMSFETDGEKVFGDLSKKYGGEAKLVEKIESYLKNFGDTFTEYEDFIGEDRAEVERFLHYTCYDNHKIDNILISLSHVDQFEDHPDYHIHRVFGIE